MHIFNLLIQNYSFYSYKIKIYYVGIYNQLYLIIICLNNCLKTVLYKGLPTYHDFMLIIINLTFPDWRIKYDLFKTLFNLK